MSQTLTPKYFGTAPNLLEMYLFMDHFHSYNFYSLGLNADDPTRVCASGSFFYDPSGATITNISGIVTFVDAASNGNTWQIVITPIVIERSGRFIEQYAAPKIVELEGSFTARYTDVPFSFNGSTIFDDKLIGIRIEISHTTFASNYAESISFNRFSINVESEEGDSFWNRYTPEKISKKISELANTVDIKKYESALHPDRVEPSNGILYYDYDGTLVKQISLPISGYADVEPPNPSHEGLVSQGWNWPYEKAKEYALKYGCAVVGQNYITDDGTTRLYVYITEKCLNYILDVKTDGTAIIDWGDGTNSDTFNNHQTSALHQYSKTGNYVIRIRPIEGQIIFDSEFPIDNSIYPYTSLFGDSYSGVMSLQRIEFGSGVVIDGWGFFGCDRLTSVTFPRELTFISDRSFWNTSALQAIILPPGFHLYGQPFSESGATVVSLPQMLIIDDYFDDGSVCYDFRNALAITIPEGHNEPISVLADNVSNITFPDDTTIIKHASSVGSNRELAIFLPDSVENIHDGVFDHCVSLHEIVIPRKIREIPDEAFKCCYCLSRIIFLGSILSIGEAAFAECYRLPWISLPDTVETIGKSAFRNCSNLKHLVIPDSVTSIGERAFSDCTSLLTIIFGKSVQSLGLHLVERSTSLKRIFFKSSVPPVGEGATYGSFSLWSTLPQDCVLYIPKGSLEAYNSAIAYPQIGFYNYVEIEYDKTYLEIEANVVDNVLELEGSGVSIESNELITMSYDAFIGTNGFSIFDRNNTLFFEHVEENQNGYTH